MGLSHGIQKYRDTAKKTAKKTAAKEEVAVSKTAKAAAASAEAKAKSAKAKEAEKTARTTKTATAATRSKKDETARVVRTAKTKDTETKKLVDVQAAVSIEEEMIETAENELESLVEDGGYDDPMMDDEDVELEQELQAEVEETTAATGTLVKEDFTPVNSTRDRLVVEYAPLIKYIAQKIAARLPTNIELDDLMSSGVIGLMDAIEKYDASRDNKFKTYAEFRIRGAILDELRAQDWVPRSVREKAKVLERCYARIEQSKGRQATEEEVCQELGINQTEFHEMVSQVRSVSLLSFDDVNNFSKTDKRALHGFTDSNNYKSPTPYSEVNTAVLKKMIADAIQDLPEKQRLVLSLYYYEDLNLKEIGRVLDVTESRVSQLHTQAILRLKSKLRNHWDEFLVLFGA